MKYVLVKARHNHKDIDNIPAIFDSLTGDQLFDFGFHSKVIHSKLNDFKDEEISIYVTGFAPVLVSVLNYCRMLHISVVLYHYNATLNKYVPQSVV